MLKDVNTNREIITTTLAAERAHLTTAYITYLLRNRRLEGFQLAREWLVYADSLETFLATPRKPGPHGPRKKSKHTTPSTTPTTTQHETAN
jgi:hypothetical protein